MDENQLKNIIVALSIERASIIEECDRNSKLLDIYREEISELQQIIIEYCDSSDINVTKRAYEKNEKARTSQKIRSMPVLGG